MTRSREDIMLGETADMIATTAWGATHAPTKDGYRRALLKAFAPLTDAYQSMRIARNRNDLVAFYGAKKEFDEALDSYYAVERGD